MEELIKEAMAKAFFASAWASAAEEAGQPPRGEIMNEMPAAIDPAAVAEAESLAAAMVRDNGRSLTDMLAWIEEHADGDREPTADMFGHYAAMQAMGHGVGLSDAFGSDVREAIKVPYLEEPQLSRPYFRFAVIVNMPGFLPEAEPVTFDYIEEARAGLLAELRATCERLGKWSALTAALISKAEEAQPGDVYMCGGLAHTIEVTSEDDQ